MAVGDSEGVSVQCPACAQTYKVSIEQHTKMIGRRMKCRKCQQTMTIPATPFIENGDYAPMSTATPPMPQAQPPAVPPPPEASYLGPLSGATLKLEGSFTPSVGLVPGESVLEVFEAAAWDIGLIAWLFGGKKRLVLTSHRVIRFEKRLLTNTLDMIWLPRVTGASVGQTVRRGGLLVGGLLLLYSVISLLGFLLGTVGFMVSRSNSSNEAASAMMALVIGIVLGLLGAVVILFSRVKVMSVMTAGASTDLKLTRLESKESQRFIDSIFRVLAYSQAE